MKMVAAARFRRAQSQAVASKPFALKIQEMLANVAAVEKEVVHPLLVAREVKNVVYYVVGADKGLAGAYNSNVAKLAASELKGRANAQLVTVGRKMREYFSRRQYKIIESFDSFSEKPSYQNAVEIARSMSAKYIAGEFDEINVIYTQFHSPLRQIPIVVKVLPVEPPQYDEFGESGLVRSKGLPRGDQEYIFEPGTKETLAALVPRYLETVIYAALINAAASELGSRMAAMSAATDNSADIIAKLTLYYNKVRQAAITREITEIVGGAEALK
jgi:F-type H+-transporting ATPase subunit gamma